MSQNKSSGKTVNWSAILNKYAIHIVLIVLFVVGTLASDNFLTLKNITNILRQVSVQCVLAFGMTLLIIGGMIDLSMGAVAALSGFVACGVYVSTNQLIPALLAAIIVSMMCGLVNGVTVTYFKLPPFIATMGMDLVARGIVYIYSGGNPIYQIGSFNKLSTGYLFGIVPFPTVVMLLIFLITLVLLRKTKIGRQIYAVGGNEEAARASGISVEKTKIKTYLISSCFVAIAGCLLMARLNSAMPDAANGYHADAVAAAVIGGTAFSGGIGTASGTLIGGLIVGILGNILDLVGVQSYIQQVIRGSIIIAAVAWDISSKNRKVRVAHR
ncbi:MAG: ABC transporter permease [Lachnospiraceae bacterium]|nr:ABC transporter permease [Lachnospiraceae bacterium]